MSRDLDTATKENSDFHVFLSQSLFSNRIKEYLYGFFGQLFKTKYSHKVKFRIQLVYELLINFTFILQLSPLWWSPSMKASGWSSYRGFWQGIAFVSYDEVCAYFSIMNFCLYGTIFLIGSCIGSFLIFGFYIYFGKEIPLILSILPRKIAVLLTTVCIIPSTMIFVMMIKYSIVKYEKIQEYAGEMSSSVYNYGVWGVFLGLFCLWALIFVNIFSESFSCDMKHSHSQKNLKARSCASFDLQRRGFYMIMCILYVSFGNSDHAFAYQIVLLMGSLYLFTICVKSAQYFNVIENSIQACNLAVISSTLLFFIFAQILDNALIIMLFTFCILPIVVYLTTIMVNKKYQNLRKNPNIPINQYEFERKFRHLLSGEKATNKTKILNLFLKFWKESQFIKDKLFVIWEFNFCLDMLKDERLARIKLSKIAYAKSSFEGDVQEWRLFNWLVRKKHSSFPDTSYLEYLKEFSRIRSQDEELCMILTELQAEFSLKKPRIQKLVNLVRRSAQHILYVSDGYKNLIEKYKKLEAFEIYASYLDDILSYHEEAKAIVRKKNGINFFNINRDARSLENYGKDLAAILVSCSDENFGTIVYINEKAAQVLKSTVGNILGSSIMNYIPQPYDSLHENLMRNFILQCDSISLSTHEKLFIQSHGGYIVECNFLIKLTAFHNCAYFLISFRPAPNIREIALITDEGIIMAHTELFSYYLTNQEKDLKNKNLSEFLPFSNIENLHDFEPWILPYGLSEMLLVKTKKQIKNISLNILILIHDENEIKKWKEGQSEDIIRHLGSFQMPTEDNESTNNVVPFFPKQKPFEVKFHSMNSQSTSTKLVEKTETDIFARSDETYIDQGYEESQPNDKRSNSSKASSIKNPAAELLNHTEKLLSNTKRKIKILLIVLFLVMSSVIITVVGILAYMKNDVLHTNALSSFRHFGDLIYEFGLSADLSLTLDTLIKTDSSYTKIDKVADSLEGVVLDLEYLQESIFQDFEKWSYCKSYEITDRSVIPLWIFDEKRPEILFNNLYDAIARFITNGKNVISSVRREKNYEKYAKFLFVNGLGNMFHYSNLTMSELVDCEVDRVKSTGEMINILLLFGFGTLGILVLVIVGYIILVSKKYDEFWNFILNHTQLQMIMIRCAAIDRLATTHGVENTFDVNLDDKIKPSYIRKVKGTLYKEYIRRLMIFFVIAASYYLLIFNYLYPNLDQTMINRPKLLNNFIIRRSLLSRSSIFSQRNYHDFYYYCLPDLYNSPNSETIKDLTIKKLKEKNTEINEQKFFNLISSELKRRLYETSEATIKELKEGTQAAIDVIIRDIENYGNSSYAYEDSVLEFASKVKVIQDEIGEEFDLADRDSKNIIDSQLNTIINTTIIYSVALSALFFFYYFPYLNLQMNQLKLFAVLPSILPTQIDY
ncbi:unnamed protein product [Blepharisma stoltei]|uniref:PAS domain-containing protein n=1 Tax=Blepharisma stoltei TaxID=1481888 RepID=A0AAU9IZL4_9CILI|nr:unnamed protein product [Blepharisma stoltei]